MPELADLRTAIYTAPSDDAPRLVLGDYLLQQGNPRGELIQVQCAIAAGNPSDALAAREQELLAAMHAPGPYVFSYERGVAKARIDTKRVPAGLFEFLAAEPIYDYVEVGPCGGGGLERWAIVKRVVELVLDRTCTLALSNVSWHMPSGPITYIPFTKEFDDRGPCAAMFADLPPRPAALINLFGVDQVELPAAWKR